MQRILIVDMDRERRSRITFLLQHMGYAVDAYLAGNGAPQPDLVLLSERVLDSQADEIAPWMLKTFGVPKLILGSEPEEVAGVPYLEMGADAYLTAPLNLRVLLARVRAALSGWERQKYLQREPDFAHAGRVAPGWTDAGGGPAEEAM